MVPRLLLLTATLTLSTSSACALVIDTFQEGPLLRGPETTDLALQQDGLSQASTIGGTRDWFALYGGSLAVDTTGGSLQLNHDRGPFEVATLRYGHALNSSLAAPLNADFTAEGHTQITFRLERTASSAPVGNKLPAYLQLSLRSGVGSANEVGASFAVRPIVSADEFVIQMPFSQFKGFFGPIDFTDIDGIELSFFFEDFAQLKIAEIATSAGLPGDYNLDGAVNAADYVVWRDCMGTTALPNRNPATGGEVGLDDYLFWKSHFGETFPNAAMSATAVPEPTTLLVFAAITACSLARLCRRAASTTRALAR